MRRSDNNKIPSQKIIGFEKRRSERQEQREVAISTSTPVELLRQEYKKIRSKVEESQSQIMRKERMYKIELLKNGSTKEKVVQVDRQFQITRIKIALDLIQKNKDNKQSPMFYNENGLSPLELSLLPEKKFQASMQGYVCMICFQDIEHNQVISTLPCEHTFHKECAMQNLLGNKYCPNCNEKINLVDYAKQLL